MVETSEVLSQLRGMSAGSQGQPGAAAGALFSVSGLATWWSRQVTLQRHVEKGLQLSFKGFLCGAEFLNYISENLPSR